MWDVKPWENVLAAGDCKFLWNYSSGDINAQFIIKNHKNIVVIPTEDEIAVQAHPRFLKSEMNFGVKWRVITVLFYLFQ